MMTYKCDRCGCSNGKPIGWVHVRYHGYKDGDFCSCCVLILIDLGLTAEQDIEQEANECNERFRKEIL
jgi:hypothetical protein